MRVIFLCLLVFFSAQLSAEMYKWVDEQGKTHFSDKPLDKNAELYTPPPIQTIPAGPTGDFSPKDEKKYIPIKYESLTITTPSNDQVFFPDSKKISIGVQVKPHIDIKAGHKVAIYLDGAIVRHGISLHHSVRNLTRGTHTASAAIVDEKGNQVFTSETISFHVKRHHR